MSLDSAIVRMRELQQLLQLPSTATGGASAPASATAFSAALSSAALSTATSASAPVASTASVGTGATGGTVPYADEIAAAAQRNGVDPALLAGLIRQESNFNAAATSGAGAQGLTQLMPGTAASLGVTDPTDPAQAIEGGAKYLAQQLQRFGGDVEQALAAYNAGPGAVQRYGGVPPYAETRAYVQRVQGYAEQYRGAFASGIPAGTAATASVPSAASATALPYSTV